LVSADEEHRCDRAVARGHVEDRRRREPHETTAGRSAVPRVRVEPSVERRESEGLAFEIGKRAAAELDAFLHDVRDGERLDVRAVPRRVVALRAVRHARAAGSERGLEHEALAVSGDERHEIDASTAMARPALAYASRP